LDFPGKLALLIEKDDEPQSVGHVRIAFQIPPRIGCVGRAYAAHKSEL
jgi:hypothetical protein